MSPRILPDIRVEVGTIYEACRVFGEERTGIEIPVTEPFVEKACGVFVNPIALRGFVADDAMLRRPVPERTRIFKEHILVLIRTRGGIPLRFEITALPNGMAIK